MSIKRWLVVGGQALAAGSLVLAGALVLQHAVNSRQAPQRSPTGPAPRAVRYIVATEMAVKPWASGHGVVVPAETWKAVAQVTARVTWVSPLLRNGALVEAQEPLLRLDQRELALVRAQVAASLAKLEAQRDRLKAQHEGDQLQLAIERRTLELATAELERQQGLAAQGTAATRAVEAAEQTRLNQASRVQGLTTSITLFPAQLAELEAGIALERARLQQADLDLEKTTISAPFQGRVWGSSIEATQYVRTGELLFQVDGLARAEIGARFSLDRLAAVMRALDTEQTIDAPLPPPAQLLAERREGIEAHVRLHMGGGMQFDWPARFERADESLDSATRSVVLIVSVAAPYAPRPGPLRPPLAKGMFVEVLLRSRRDLRALVVPRAAVHQGRVRIADANDRLVELPVRVEHLLGELALLQTGSASTGQRVLVTDVVPPAPGTWLAPVEDRELTQHLQRQAATGPAAAPRDR